MPIPKNSRLGYGLMNFTWKPKQTPDEQAFEAIKTAVDGGSTMLNSGDFYGTGEPTLNLQLLSRFYSKYPDYVDKTYLSVKSGLTYGLDSSEENIRKAAIDANKILGKKKVDLFQICRVDKRRSVEEIMKNLKTVRDEGHFKDIGLSEVSAATVRKAAAVVEIAAVEVEYSLMSLNIEKNGVLEACTELNIPIVAYSPLGRGLLTGTITKPEDIPEGDNRKNFDRFQPENFEKNQQYVVKLQDFAKKKNITPSQMALSWLIAKSPLVYPIPGSTRVEGVNEALGALDVKFSKEEFEELSSIIASGDVVGGRYAGEGKDLEG